MKRILASAFVFMLLNLTVTAAAVWDYDGDGKTDLMIRRYSEPGVGGNHNRVYTLKSRDGFFFTDLGSFAQQNCASSTVPGDFDGDGKTDVAVVYGCLESAQMYFYIINSSNNTSRVVQWGLRTEDRIMPQDYDGDGKTDFGVYRRGWWYILNSSDGSFRAEPFGSFTLEDEPVFGDYDGDHKADLAVVRWSHNVFEPNPVTFYIRQSTNGAWRSFTMGDARGDVVVPGDYDGDGKTDIALWGGKNEFGDGRWKWIRSSDGQFVSIRYGLPEDRAVPGDYDGDGKTDLAVYRQGIAASPQGYFYILQSRDGFKAAAWGSRTFEDLTPMTFMNSL
jgi:hypothetical protein